MTTNLLEIRFYYAVNEFLKVYIRSPESVNLDKCATWIYKKFRQTSDATQGFWCTHNIYSECRETEFTLNEAGIVDLLKASRVLQLNRLIVSVDVPPRCSHSEGYTYTEMSDDSSMEVDEFADCNDMLVRYPEVMSSADLDHFLMDLEEKQKLLISTAQSTSELQKALFSKSEDEMKFDDQFKDLQNAFQPHMPPPDVTEGFFDPIACPTDSAVDHFVDALFDFDKKDEEKKVSFTLKKKEQQLLGAPMQTSRSPEEDQKKSADFCSRLNQMNKEFEQKIAKFRLNRVELERKRAMEGMNTMRTMEEQIQSFGSSFGWSTDATKALVEFIPREHFLQRHFRNPQLMKSTDRNNLLSMTSATSTDIIGKMEKVPVETQTSMGLPYMGPDYLHMWVNKTKKSSTKHSTSKDKTIKKKSSVRVYKVDDVSDMDKQVKKEEKKKLKEEKKECQIAKTYRNSKYAKRYLESPYVPKEGEIVLLHSIDELPFKVMEDLDIVRFDGKNFKKVRMTSEKPEKKLFRTVKSQVPSKPMLVVTEEGDINRYPDDVIEKTYRFKNIGMHNMSNLTCQATGIKNIVNIHSYGIPRIVKVEDAFDVTVVAFPKNGKDEMMLTLQLFTSNEVPVSTRLAICEPKCRSFNYAPIFAPPIITTKKTVTKDQQEINSLLDEMLDKAIKNVEKMQLNETKKEITPKVNKITKYLKKMKDVAIDIDQIMAHAQDKKNDDVISSSANTSSDDVMACSTHTAIVAPENKQMTSSVHTAVDEDDHQEKEQLMTSSTHTAIVTSDDVMTTSTNNNVETVNDEQDLMTMSVHTAVGPEDAEKKEELMMSSTTTAIDTPDDVMISSTHTAILTPEETKTSEQVNKITRYFKKDTRYLDFSSQTPPEMWDSDDDHDLPPIVKKVEKKAVEEKKEKVEEKKEVVEKKEKVEEKEKEVVVKTQQKAEVDSSEDDYEVVSEESDDDNEDEDGWVAAAPKY